VQHNLEDLFSNLDNEKQNIKENKINNF